MDAALLWDVFAEAADPCRELVARNSRNGPCHAVSFAPRHYQPPHHCVMSPVDEAPSSVEGGNPAHGAACTPPSPLRRCAAPSLTTPSHLRFEEVVRDRGRRRARGM